MVSPYTSEKQTHTINTDIPVYAFECNPCEFVIENIWNNEYDAKWGNDAEKTKITIRVNNVMTYYRNGLLDRKLSNVLIYDLFDAMDRAGITTTYSSNTNMSINQSKGQFLKKQVLLENEDIAINDARIMYGTAEELLDEDPYTAEPYYREIINTMMPHSLLAERVKANWWHEATVEGRDYWSNMGGWDGLLGGGTWRNIGKGLWNVITAATTQIRVS
jgi:hypothetical protein